MKPSLTAILRTVGGTTSWAQPSGVQENILRELLVALDSPVHEGLIPPYGSIIFPADAEVETLGLDIKEFDIARR